MIKKSEIFTPCKSKLQRKLHKYTKYGFQEKQKHKNYFIAIRSFGTDRTKTKLQHVLHVEDRIKHVTPCTYGIRNFKASRFSCEVQKKRQPRILYMIVYSANNVL